MWCNLNKTLTIVLEIPNVIALNDGAISKWFAKWPHELKANNAMQHEIILWNILKWIKSLSTIEI